jgi:hypothetical protein
VENRWVGCGFEKRPPAPTHLIFFLDVEAAFCVSIEERCDGDDGRKISEGSEKAWEGATRRPTAATATAKRNQLNGALNPVELG